jgi:hypothetical protein
MLWSTFATGALRSGRRQFFVKRRYTTVGNTVCAGS